MQKAITLDLTHIDTGVTHEFAFVVDSDKYHRLQNALMGKDKVSPLHNFAVACVVPDQKPNFVAYLVDNEGMAAQVAGTLVDEFLPKVEITIKKPTTGQTTSETAD